LGRGRQSLCYNARVIRAYIPWHLVRNYLVFAFVACLGALQVARARRDGTSYTVGIAILVGAFFGFYALAPELLTPGLAGGEMTFLFGGAALLAAVITQVVSRFSHSEPRSGEESRLRATGTLRFAQGDRSQLLKLEFWYLIFPFLSLLAVLFDVPLFHILNGVARHTPLMDVPVQFLMNDYLVPTTLVLALLALWFAGRDDSERLDLQQTVLRALVALALASIVLKLINQVYFRPRPFTFDDSVRLLFYHPSDSSMPSNAATVCFALSLAVWLQQRRWGTMMLALSVGMTLARVIGGVHYPADIVAGAWLGGASAWLVSRMVWLDHPLAVVTSLVRRMRLG
jgi:undecaprenyl-diphosphatase